jgi:uncharacterized Zn-finger protein
MRRSQSAHVNTRRLRKAKGILLAAAMPHKSRGNKHAELRAISHRVYCESTYVGYTHKRVFLEQNNFGKCGLATRSPVARTPGDYWHIQTTY